MRFNGSRSACRLRSEGLHTGIAWEIFTDDEGDVVIDPVAGSGATLRAAYECGRNSYGFEVDRNFHAAAQERMIEPLFETQPYEQLSIF